MFPPVQQWRKSGRSRGAAARGIRKRLLDLCSDRAGGVATTLALAAIPMIGMTGVAVDYGRNVSTRAAMQAALDAAALDIVHDAAALPSARLGTNALDVLTANFYRPDVTNIHVTAAFDAKTATLTLNGSADLTTTLMGLTGMRKMGISTLSKAQARGDSNCVIALDPKAATGFSASGAGTVNVPNCSIFVNSNAPAALKQTGAGWITAKSIKVVGGAGAGNYAPAPKTKQPALVDPLAGIPEPTIPAGCTYNNYTFSTPTTIAPNSVLCGTTKFDANITFQQGGTYYFKGATVTAPNNINITGNEVMLYFDDPSTFSSTGSGIFSLTAPQTGAYAGIAMFGTRTGTMSNFTLTGSKDYFVNGTVYLPTVKLQLNGTIDLAVSSKSGYVIAQQFAYQGDSSFTFDTFGSAAPPALAANDVVLIQ